MDAPGTIDARIGALVDGRYRIEAALGRGGMASVYRAVHVHTSRRVALKLLHARPGWGATETERFVREARIAASLAHPHIVEVIDADVAEDGTAFIALELLEGESLAARLERDTKIAAPEAVEIIAQVLDALAVAHRAGIVHRDIKPENIFLSPGESGLHVRLLDFGVSKVLRSNEGSLAGRSLTETGHLVGTVDYMSPEQIRGDEVTAASDLWAVGVVLFQLLTGRRPFRGKNPALVMMAILMTEARPLAALVPGLAAEIGEVVARLLTRDAAARPADAAAVRDELLRAVEPREASADPRSDAALEPVHGASTAPTIIAACDAAPREVRPAARAREVRRATRLAAFAATFLALAGLAFATVRAARSEPPVSSTPASDRAASNSVPERPRPLVIAPTDEPSTAAARSVEQPERTVRDPHERSQASPPPTTPVASRSRSHPATARPMAPTPTPLVGAASSPHSTNTAMQPSLDLEGP